MRKSFFKTNAPKITHVTSLVAGFYLILQTIKLLGIKSMTKIYVSREIIFLFTLAKKAGTNKKKNFHYLGGDCGLFQKFFLII